MKEETQWIYQKDRNNKSGKTRSKTHLDRIISRTYLKLYVLNCTCLAQQTHNLFCTKKMTGLFVSVVGKSHFYVIEFYRCALESESRNADRV